MLALGLSTTAFSAPKELSGQKILPDTTIIFTALNKPNDLIHFVEDSQLRKNALGDGGERSEEPTSTKVISNFTRISAMSTPRSWINGLASTAGRRLAGRINNPRRC